MSSDAVISLVGVVLGGMIAAAAGWAQATIADKRQRRREREARMWEQRRDLYIDLLRWADPAQPAPESLRNHGSLVAQLRAFGSPKVYTCVMAYIVYKQRLKETDENDMTGQQQWGEEAATARHRMIDVIRLEFGAEDLVRRPGRLSTHPRSSSGP